MRGDEATALGVDDSPVAIHLSEYLANSPTQRCAANSCIMVEVKDCSLLQTNYGIRSCIALLELDAKGNTDHGDIEASDNSNDVGADKTNDSNSEVDRNAGGDGEEAAKEAAENLTGETCEQESSGHRCDLLTRRWQGGR